MLFVTSLEVMIAVLFCLGAMRTINLTLSYVYLIELMPRKFQALVGTLFNIVEACTFLCGTLYFWVVSNNYFYYLLIGYVLQLWAFFASLCLPESPRLLIGLQRLDEAKVSFMKIARRNGKRL